MENLQRHRRIKKVDTDRKSAETQTDRTIYKDTDG